MGCRHPFQNSFRYWIVRLVPASFLALVIGGSVCGCSAEFWNAMAQGAANASQAGTGRGQQSTISSAPVTTLGHNCPSCNMSMYFTGTTQVEWGKLMNLYRCPVGHEYWYNDAPDLVMPIVQDPCPICGAGTYFTGKTRVEWGKLQKIYKCPAGHESVK